LKEEPVKDRTLKALAYLGPANFAAYLVGNLVLGGDALNGKVANGHYYLSSHGRLTDVSRGIFVYSV